jgi:hypothetical protein
MGATGNAQNANPTVMAKQTGIRMGAREYVGGIATLAVTARLLDS